MTIEIDLSWPEPCLWPNRRVSWQGKTAAVRAARDEGFVMTLDAITRQGRGQLSDDILVRIIGHKPAEHGQDRDNFQAALKHHLDGIASALGVNDSRFSLSVEWGAGQPPRGGVTVTIG